MLHPLLQRQIRKAGLTEHAPPRDDASWRSILEAVHRTYTQADQDRELLNRSVDLSSAEMRDLHEKLAAHNSELEQVVAVRTAELEAALERDRLRMDELEVLVQQRTAELRHTALHDKLTGLPNRALLYDRLYHTVRRRERDPDHRFSVLFVDLDRFKVINDSLGHEYGDMLLRSIAERLLSTLRDTDAVCRAGEAGYVAARLGGDEFCILLDDLRSDSDAARVATRLLDVLSRPHDLNGRMVVVTASIGIAQSGSGCKTAEDILRDADIAMYRAKRQGKARFVVFDEAMHAVAMRRLVMENDLRLAIERGQMWLAFQPIVSLATGEAVGAEALLRWDHPEYGPIPPSDFIPLAEETDAIVEIGEWVLRTVVEQLRNWRATNRGKTLRYLSVNVSPRQVADASFVPFVRDILAKSQLPPGMLTLEITEGTVIENPVGARETIDALRRLGVRVFIDDFGTGYSSFGVLHDFPLDGLKLDRRFVVSTVRAAACIHSVVTLVRTLGMDVVAEGVESLEQVGLLQALDCEHAQGYLFGRPAAADQFLIDIEALCRQPYLAADFHQEAAAT